MDVQTITMPKDEAKVKLEAYRKRLAKMKIGKANTEIAAEYKAAAEGYAALAEGAVLLDLEDVINNCPTDEKGRPKLAISRADRTQIKFMQSDHSKNAYYTSDAAFYPSNAFACLEARPTLTTKVVRNEEYVNKINNYAASLVGYALVPMVPADVRPTTGQLKDWYVLWEVEKWSDNEVGVEPDRDPYLLKHLAGSLYAVIAEWDLTDLERSIMRGRAS